MFENLKLSGRAILCTVTLNKIFLGPHAANVKNKKESFAFYSFSPCKKPAKR
jgi:hypothetical protein